MKEIIAFFSECGTNGEKLATAVVLILIGLILPTSVAPLGWVAVVMAVGYEVAAFALIVKVMKNQYKDEK